MMNELIKVNYDSERPTVLGRDLHEALEIKTAYKDWFPRMCEYGFEENVDFKSLKIERVQIEGSREVKREVTDHQLTIEMAKEICMIQRSEKGKQVRQYFINLEKAWNTPEMIMSRALRMADSRIKEQEKALSEAHKQIEVDKPKVLFADAVSASHTSILVGDLAKILKQNGVEMGARRLFDWMREKGFLIKQRGASYNMPTQRAMEMGLFEIKETVIAHADGHTSISKTPKITGKGQQYFVNLFFS